MKNKFPDLKIQTIRELPKISDLLIQPQEHFQVVSQTIQRYWRAKTTSTITGKHQKLIRMTTDCSNNVAIAVKHGLKIRRLLHCSE